MATSLVSLLDELEQSNQPESKPGLMGLLDELESEKAPRDESGVMTGAPPPDVIADDIPAPAEPTIRQRPGDILEATAQQQIQEQNAPPPEPEPTVNPVQQAKEVVKQIEANEDKLDPKEVKLAADFMGEWNNTPEMKRSELLPEGMTLDNLPVVEARAKVYAKRVFPDFDPKALPENLRATADPKAAKPVMDQLSRSINSRRESGRERMLTLPPAERERYIWRQKMLDRLEIARAVGDEEGFNFAKNALDNESEQEFAVASSEAKFKETSAYAEAFKSVVGGATFGLGDMAIRKAYKSMGMSDEDIAEIQTAGNEGNLAVGNNIVRMLSGVYGVGKLGKGVGSLLKGVNNTFLRNATTRMGTGFISSLGNAAAGLESGRINEKQAKAEILSGVLSSVIPLYAELKIQQGLGNFLGQVSADLATDLLLDATLTGRIKEVGFKEWLLKEELPALALSVAFAGRDFFDKGFAGDQAQQIADFKRLFKSSRYQSEVAFDQIQSGRAPDLSVDEQLKYLKGKGELTPDEKQLADDLNRQSLEAQRALEQEPVQAPTTPVFSTPASPNPPRMDAVATPTEKAGGIPVRLDAEAVAEARIRSQTGTATPEDKVALKASQNPIIEPEVLPKEGQQVTEDGSVVSAKKVGDLNQPFSRSTPEQRKNRISTVETEEEVKSSADVEMDKRKPENLEAEAKRRNEGGTLHIEGVRKVWTHVKKRWLDPRKGMSKDEYETFIKMQVDIGSAYRSNLESQAAVKYLTRALKRAGIADADDVVNRYITSQNSAVERRRAYDNEVEEINLRYGHEETRRKTIAKLDESRRKKIERLNADASLSARAKAQRRADIDAEWNAAKAKVMAKAEANPKDEDRKQKLIEAKARFQREFSAISAGIITEKDIRAIALKLDSEERRLVEDALSHTERIQAMKADNSLKIADYMEKLGMDQALVNAVRNNPYYLTRFYRMHVLGKNYVPNKVDYDRAVDLIRSETEQAILQFDKRANDLAGSGADLEGWLKTGDEAKLGRMTHKQKLQAKMLLGEYNRLSTMMKVDFASPGTVDVEAHAVRVADNAKAMIDDMLDPKAGWSKGGGDNFSAMNLTAKTLKSKVFRQLFGEFTSPHELLGRSIEIQRTLIAQNAFTSRVHSLGEGLTWSSAKLPSLGLTVRLGSVDETGMPTKASLRKYGSLAGKYVSKELAGEMGYRDPEFYERVFEGMLRASRKLAGAQRGSALMSWKAISRNAVTSVSQFAAGAGDLGVRFSKYFAEGTSIMVRAAKGDVAAKKILTEMAELNVYREGSQSSIQDIQMLFKPGAKFTQGFRSFYAAVDFPAKYAAYKSRVERYSKKYKAKSTEEISKMAVDHVHKYYQNRDALIGLADIGTDIPFLGDYMAYKFDSLRIQKNQVIGLFQAMRNRDAGEFWRRFTGMAIANTQNAIVFDSIYNVWQEMWGEHKGRIDATVKYPEAVQAVSDPETRNALRVFAKRYAKNDWLFFNKQDIVDAEGRKRPVYYYTVWGGGASPLGGAFPATDTLLGATRIGMDEKSWEAFWESLWRGIKDDYFSPGMMTKEIHKFYTGRDVETGFVDKESGIGPALEDLRNPRKAPADVALKVGNSFFKLGQSILPRQLVSWGQALGRAAGMLDPNKQEREFESTETPKDLMARSAQNALVYRLENDDIDVVLVNQIFRQWSEEVKAGKDIIDAAKEGKRKDVVGFAVKYDEQTGQDKRNSALLNAQEAIRAAKHLDPVYYDNKNMKALLQKGGFSAEEADLIVNGDYDGLGAYTPEMEKKESKASKEREKARERQKR